MPQAEKQILQGILTELLENGIIQESKNPVLLVKKKKTGDYRMCVDYRRLNAMTVKDKYPLPIIDEQQVGNKYSTTLDLATEFYQVLVENNSVAKTAFITPDSHYEFLRMPFGLCNAPSSLSATYEQRPRAVEKYTAFPYMDDIIIPSVTLERGTVPLTPGSRGPTEI
jgi:hypothetical protein